jgi:type III secretion system FlhB-like substrate exporter
MVRCHGTNHSKPKGNFHLIKYGGYHMKKAFTLIMILLITSVTSGAMAAACTAIASDCNEGVTVQYNPQLGETCQTLDVGDAASVRIYDADGNLINFKLYQCPRGPITPC